MLNPGILAFALLAGRLSSHGQRFTRGGQGACLADVLSMSRIVCSNCLTGFPDFTLPASSSILNNRRSADRKIHGDV